MCLRHKILTRAAVGAAIFVLVVVLVAFVGSKSSRGISPGFTTTNGHFGVLYANQIVVLWATNTAHSTVTLRGREYVEFVNAAGHIIKDMSPSWNQEGSDPSLPPGGVAWLATGFDTDRNKLRFVFETHGNPNTLLISLSKVVGALPLARLPDAASEWLRRNGLVDGIVYAHYESPWFTNHPANEALERVEHYSRQSK
jgi:hypothetical protein